MNTIQKLISSYDGEAIRLISDAVEEHMPDEAKSRLYSALHGHVSGGHFDETFAKEAVDRMYYTDEAGAERHAPYWTESAVREWYEEVKDRIPGYNFWDFLVTVNMVASDNHALVTKWFPDSTPEERERRYVELAVNFLDDPDNPYGNRKVWSYLNPSR